MGGYLRHIELSKQLEKRAKEASQARQLAEEKLTELQGLFEVAKKHDCQLGDAEDLLAQAKSAMGAKDYRLALEKVNDGEDKIKAAFLQRVHSILDSSGEMLELLKRTGEDTSEYQALMGSAQDALDKGNFEEAMETAKRGWSKGEKLLHDYLSKSFSSTQAFVLAAKAMEKETQTAEELLAQAREALDGDDYSDALSRVEEAQDLLGRELDFELVEERKAVDQLLEAGRALQADLSKAEGHLNRFDQELKNANYEKAFSALKQAKGEAERTLQKTIEGGGASLDTPIQEAKKLGVDTTAAEGIAEEVGRAVEAKDFTAASQLVRKGVEELENAKFQLVLTTISQSRPKFLQAQEMGASVQGAVDIFNKARQALQEGDFKDALYRAEKGNEVLDGLLGEHQSAREKAEALAQEVQAFAEQGMELGEAESLLRSAGEELARGNLDSWNSLTQRVEKSLEGARTDRAEGLLEEVQFLLTFAERADLTVTEEAAAAQELSQILKSGDGGKAFREARSLTDALKEKVSGHLEERLASLQQVFPGDLPEAIAGLIGKAKTALEMGDFETAVRIEEEARGQADAASREVAAAVLEGLKASQELSAEHEIEGDGLREAYLTAKRAFDEGDLAAVYEQRTAVKDRLAAVAQGAFDRVKARVIEARDAGLAIDEMKQHLVKAKAAIDEGRTVLGLTALRRADERAKEGLEAYRKVHSITASAAAFIAEGKKKAVDMSRAVEILLKAKAAFESGDLERALELARDARGEAERQISVLNVTDRILSAKEALDLAQMLEVDVSVWSNLLQRAKQSLDARDFREAVELAMETEEQARAGVRDKINAKVAKAEALLDRVQVPAPEVDVHQATINQAKELLNERKLREAAEAVQETVARCQELADSYDRVIEVLRRAQELANELQSMNVKITGPQKLLVKADKAYGEGNLRHAAELAEEALATLEQQRNESIARTLQNFDGVVARAKESGINTASAEEMLRSAHSLFEEGKYQEAISTAMQSETEVEKMGLQKEIAENALETARGRIASLPQAAPALLERLKEAERIYEEGDYVACLETAVATSDEYAKVRDNWEQMEKAEEAALRFYKTAERTGEDMTKLQSLLAEGQRAAERGELEAAIESYDRLATDAASLTSTYVTRLHSEVRNAMVLCNLLDCEVDDVEDKISEGRSYADESRFEAAVEILSDAKQRTSVALRAKVEELLADSVAAADHAEKVGVDPSKARSMIEEAREAMAQGAFEKAVRLAQESHAAIQTREEFHKSFMDSTLKAESLIRTAKKFGIDVKAAEGSLQEALKLKDTDPDASLEKGREALEAVQGAMEAFSPTLEADLQVERATTGAWNDAVLMLRNVGKALGKDLELEVLGDLEVQSLEAPDTIRAKGDVTVPFQLAFNAAGTIPVVVRAKVKRVLDGQEYDWEEVFNVEVEGPEETAPQTIVAEYDSKCALCRGAIKKGFSATKCTCGTLLHEPCAKRAGACPSCERSL